MKLRISDQWLSSPSDAAVRNWLIGSIVLAAVGYTAVTLAFIRAEFPGTLFQAQLAFGGETIKAQYATLIQQGTFGAYVTAQIIDYAWIFGLMLTLFFAHVAIARAQTNPGWRNLALSLAIIAPAIASADAFENLVSFFMLASPQDFPNWLAPVYLSLAAIKWGWSVIGVSILIVEVITLVVTKLWRRKIPSFSLPRDLPR